MTSELNWNVNDHRLNWWTVSTDAGGEIFSSLEQGCQNFSFDSEGVSKNLPYWKRSTPYLGSTLDPACRFILWQQNNCSNNIPYYRYMRRLWWDWWTRFSLTCSSSSYASWSHTDTAIRTHTEWLGHLKISSIMTSSIRWEAAQNIVDPLL